MMKLLLVTVLVATCATISQQADVTKNEYVREVTERGTFFNTPEGRYFMSTDQVNWISATRACNNQGSSLVSLDTIRKNDFIKNLLVTGGMTGSYWTGGNLVYDVFFWTNLNQPFALNPTDLKDWAAGEPNQKSLTDDCVMVEGESGWFDDDCNSMHFYICEE